MPFMKQNPIATNIEGRDKRVHVTGRLFVRASVVTSLLFKLPIHLNESRINGSGRTDLAQVLASVLLLDPSRQLYHLLQLQA